MTTPPMPPAGWYSDPEVAGQQRYWDGQQWAAQTNRSARLSDQVEGQVRFASFGKRLGAWLIDNIIMWGGAMVISLPFGATSAFDSAAALVGVVILTAMFLYRPIMEASKRQASFGKQAVGLVVTDMEGKRITFGRALGRNAARFVARIFLIGYIMIATDSRHQGLHDRMAKCFVLERQAGNRP